MLSAVNGIDARLPHEALCKILHALQQLVTPPEAEQSARVITALAGITATDPAEVVRAARTLFRQHGWHVQGNVYQAARDIHVTLERQSPAPVRTWLDKWQTWVVFLAALFVLITVGLDLPTRLQEIFHIESSQTLSGVIWNERREPLADVEVFLPEFNLTAITNQHGAFTLQVKAAPQRPVRLIARKSAYATYRSDATLGNTSINFIMRREP